MSGAIGSGTLKDLRHQSPFFARVVALDTATLRGVLEAR